MIDKSGGKEGEGVEERGGMEELWKLVTLPVVSPCQFKFCISTTL